MQFVEIIRASSAGPAGDIAGDLLDRAPPELRAIPLAETTLRPVRPFREGVRAEAEPVSQLLTSVPGEASMIREEVRAASLDVVTFLSVDSF